MAAPETRTQEIHREVVTLREHFEALRKADREEVNRRFSDQEKAVNAALAAADKAVGKAEMASEKRADASNEIRQAMVDQQGAFVTKVEATGLERRLAILEDITSRSAGKSLGISATTAAIYAAIAAAAAIIGVIAVFKPFN